jgi:hypothetical protein
VKAVAWELVAVASALLIAGAAVGPGGDDGLFVPPPEAAAESFLRAMAEHRYARARGHLAAGLESIEPGDLAALQARLERARGTVENVHGQDAVVTGKESTARVTLRFSGGDGQLDLPLRREKGLWKVASLDPLRALAGAGEASAMAPFKPWVHPGVMAWFLRTSATKSMDPMSPEPGGRAGQIRDAMAAAGPLASGRHLGLGADVMSRGPGRRALRRAAMGWWQAAPEVEHLAGAVRSAWTALRDLESLGPPVWPARGASGDLRRLAPAPREDRRGPDGDL